MKNIEYIESKGEIKCCICGIGLFGKVKKGSEDCSYCYVCVSASLKNSIDGIMGEIIGGKN